MEALPMDPLAGLHDLPTPVACLPLPRDIGHALPGHSPQDRPLNTHGIDIEMDQLTNLGKTVYREPSRKRRVRQAG